MTTHENRRPTALGRALLLLPLAALPGLTAGDEQEEAADLPSPETYTVVRTGERLYAQPLAYGGVKERLEQGTVLELLGSKGRFRRVAALTTGDEPPALEGWVLFPRQLKRGGARLEPRYLQTTTTAAIGAGLVTKGFGETYARQHGATEEQAAEAGAIEEQQFSWDEFERFVHEGNLRLPSPATPVAPAVELPDEEAEGPRSALRGKDRFRGSDLGSAFGARQRMRDRMAMADPMYFQRNMPLEMERELGLGVALRLASGRILVDEALTGYVSQLGALLVEHCERADLPFRFTVLDSPEINAFAAPGGYVFITKGCILACESEAELAGVLGHEIAHIARRHALRAMDQPHNNLRIRKKLQGAEMDRALEEIYGPMDPELRGLINRLSSLADEHYRFCTGHWGREFELEADAFGLRYVHEVGWDFQGLLEFLKKLEATHEATLGEAWATHPPPPERIENLRDVIAADALSPTGVWNAERFSGYRGRLLER